MISCLSCKVEFDPVDVEQRYCSKKCRKTFQNELRRNRKRAFDNISMDVITNRPEPSLVESNADERNPSTVSLTRADEALQYLSPERVTSLLATGARYSESTLKKHTWVMKLYSGFCSALDVEPWPLDPVIASGFVRFLGLDAKYAIASVEDVIVPSLKRMHMEHCDEAIPRVRV